MKSSSMPSNGHSSSSQRRAGRALRDQLELVRREHQRVVVPELAAAVQPHVDPAALDRALDLVAGGRQARDQSMSREVGCA